MYTIMVSRCTVGTITLSGCFGTFADATAASYAASAIESAPGFVSAAILDVVPIPDGVTPMPLHPSFLSA